MRRETEESFKALIVTGSILLFFLWCLVSLSSCKTIKQAETVTDTIVDVRIEKAEGVRVTNISTELTQDKLHVIVLNEKGDTVKEKERIYIKDSRTREDSTAYYKSIADSLNHVKARVQIKVVEKSLSWWEKICIEYFGCAISISLVLFCIALFLIKRR